MAPSRGVYAFLQARNNPFSPVVRRYSHFTNLANNAANRTQIYVSRSLDPYLNLSIEHYLLQKTHPESTILFLYTNRPCIVLGRNQNPWFEVNLGLLQCGGLQVELVRRRSGGGTVFHDEGNVNYSVICPPSAFDKDKHAEMVVRALRQLGVERARVNERHDIVVDKNVDSEEKTFKVSGSAYKLVRTRSLHHGTCLLSSPNLPIISRYLRSKAKPFIKARGVESVSSPITNTGIANEHFERCVILEFEKMYGKKEAVIVGDTEKHIPDIVKGVTELKSLDWIYCQTPQFTFSYNNVGIPTKADATDSSSQHLSIDFTARHGEITEIEIDQPGTWNSELSNDIGEALKGQKLHEIKDWTQVLPQTSRQSLYHPGVVMNDLLGCNNQQQSDVP